MVRKTRTVAVRVFFFRRRSVVLGLVLLLLPASGSGQWLADTAAQAHLRRGIDCVYNLAFDSARVEFRAITRSHPDHPAGHFFLAAVEWWRILIDLDNTARDENFLTMLDQVIELCDRRLDADEHDVAALFFKGGALGFQGRLHGNRGDWVKAANAGREALPIIREAYALAPENADVLFGIGIYNYYAAVVPEQYPLVKPLMLFFPAGDKAKGLSQLRKASEAAQYANVEASYFLLQTLYNYEGRAEEALPIAERLFTTYPRNAVFHRLVGRCQASLNRTADAESTWTEAIRRVNSGGTGYSAAVEREARYYLGVSAMLERRTEAALEQLYRCDELSRTLDTDGASGFMVLANLKIGMLYDLQAKRALAVEQYNKVLKMNDFQKAHDQARMYLKSPFRS